MTTMQTPTNPPSHIKTLSSPEEQERILAECRAMDEANAKAWADLMTEWKALKAKTQEFIGYSHLRYRPTDPTRVWMSKGPLEHSFHTFNRSWATRMSETFESLRQQQAREAKQKVEAEQKKHLDLKPARAVLFLLKNGKVEGQDFTVESAVYHANELAKSRLVTAKMAEGGPFAFSGEDSCDDCDGWDGESHRCNCGNRRVDWEMSGDFEAFEAGHAFVYGEAY